MTNKIELLAPAGTYEAFLAAVENGADAVYMGGKLFNARANASNFDMEELKKIVEYAHLRKVKIHITMNTLLDDTELTEALDFAYDLYEIGVDAVIVQDIGLAKVLHEHIPHLSLHASTQLSTHNLEGVQKLAEIGFSRVVLARELSIEEIQFICENTDTEIEIFAHGAMCVSYSGECLMSSMIGDRSGNRGKCAQPCRLPYKLIKNEEEVGNGYLLSPKDLASIDLLQKLPNVTSLKIEGRMKSPEYVATVVRIYKKMLTSAEDKALSQEDKTDLAQIFNRGGFSRGYLYGKTGRDMMCYEKPKNWGVYVGKVKSYDGKRYITIDSPTPILQIGDGIEIWNHSNHSPSTIVSEIVGHKIGRIHGDIHVGDKIYKTSDKALNQKARESYTRGFVKHTPIGMKVFILRNQHVRLEINDLANIENTENSMIDFYYTSPVIPEKSENQPLTREKVMTQFSKTGNTPFEVTDMQIILDDGLYLPVSTINDIRRSALSLYEQFILKYMKPVSLQKTRRRLPAIQPYISAGKEAKEVPQVSLFFNDLHMRDGGKSVNPNILLRNVDSYYFKFKDALGNMDLIQKFSGKKYIVLPLISKANYAQLIKKNIESMSKQVDGFVLSNIGQLKYFETMPHVAHHLEFIANYTFNTFNTYTIDELESLGFSKVILSPELTKNQINSLGGTLPREVIAYGNLCVMTSEYCPIGAICGGFTAKSKCSMPCQKSDKFFLRDRLNMDFRVLPDNIDCQSQILNAKITSMETTGLYVDSIRIDVLDENLAEIQKIIDIHKSGKKLAGEVYTNGHLNRPV